MQEKTIERYKQLYAIAKDHKHNRNEILKIVASEYHKIKNGLKDELYLLYDETAYSELMNDSKKIIYDNFQNEHLRKEFSYTPPINIKPIDREKFEADYKKQIISDVRNEKPTFWEEFLKNAAILSTQYTDSINAHKENKKETLEYRLKYFEELYNCLKLNGLHPNIKNRTEKSYCLLIKTKDYSTYIKWNISKTVLERDYISKYSNIRNSLLIDGRQILISDLRSTYIISHIYKEDEIALYFEAQGKSQFDASFLSKEIFIYLFENEADELLPHNTIDHSLDEDALKAVISLKELLIIKEGKTGERNKKYKINRRILENHPEAWSLTPYLIKDYHSFDEFWANNKHTFELKSHITQQFKPLIKFLEERSRTIIDKQVKNILSFFNTEEITKYWNKSNESIDLDPEEAISRSKSLLESIFKHILDSQKVNYESEKDDFPTLYKLVAKQLDLSPKKEHDKIFNQILNGCISVMEGVNATRNKMGSSHGKNISQLKYLPSKRHAELVVNLSGAMAIFIIKTWKHLD